MSEFPWQQPAIIQHTQRLLKSYQHWVGKPLLDSLDAQALFEAPFVVVSHGTQSDPIFNYANQRALDLWEMDWETFTQLPSRKSAEPISQEERSRLLAEANANGYISDYRGVRISSQGKRFWIENVILWTVLDESNQPCGQAATFCDWKFIV